MTEVFHPAVELTADIISAYVSNNAVPPAELPSLIAQIHASLRKLASGEAAEAQNALKPPVPVKKSVTPDYIVCLEDGKRFKSLKRHLTTHYNMTPDEYRTKWNLPKDYPMVAPNYAAARSALAKKMGLGRRPETPATKPARGRKKVAA